MQVDAWDPTQYERFRAERAAPFRDLLQLVEPVPGGRLVDLGCGAGDLTRLAHERLGVRETTGIDDSPAMLERAANHAGGGLTFSRGDIAEYAGGTVPVDVVLSNAALQWVPDHREVLRRWTAALAPGGQLAVQVPANADHASHTTAVEVASDPEFRDDFGGAPPPDPVLSVLAPEAYASLLASLDFADQHVRLVVYGHWLASTAEVVEWMKGTSLTRFARMLPAHRYERFVERYRARLLETLGDERPYFYPFKRILLWGRRKPGESPCAVSHDVVHSS